MPAVERVVLITRKTALEELIERFSTKEQARFYLEHMGASFDEYEDAHHTYLDSLAILRKSVPKEVRLQIVERSFLPTFAFRDGELVVTLGPDGLVVNVAKYLAGQPLLAFNPDPKRIDGVLIPFTASAAELIMPHVVRGRYWVSKVSMAKATLNDGQTLYAVNDLFVGQRTHVSARYRLSFRGRTEDHISSGIVISTGAGSTGWLRSIVTGARAIGESHPGAKVDPSGADARFSWDAQYLSFSVREPFTSKVSSATIVFDRIEAGECLEITSRMPQNGVIFSDGVESDYLRFDSGTRAEVGLAEESVSLVVGVGGQ